jgi:hypothetical protein
MQANPFHGRWRIVEMETWDQDYVDMEVPGYIELDKSGGGSFQFGLVQGTMDCRFELSADRPVVRFSWAGNDEMDQASGRGWAKIDAKGRLKGRIFIHDGDDSAFTATAIVASADEARRSGSRGPRTAGSARSRR